MCIVAQLEQRKINNNNNNIVITAEMLSLPEDQQCG
jgi:hypothetical protein